MRAFKGHIWTACLWNFTNVTVVYYKKICFTVSLVCSSVCLCTCPNALSFVYNKISFNVFLCYFSVFSQAYLKNFKLYILDKSNGLNLYCVKFCNKFNFRKTSYQLLFICY